MSDFEQWYKNDCGVAGVSAKLAASQAWDFQAERIHDLEQRLAAVGRQKPVAWLHDDPKRFDVIHAEVKELLQKAGGHLHRPLDKTERYTVPLYTRPQPASTVAVPRDLVDRLIHQGYTYADIDALRKLLAQEDKE